MDFRFHSQCRLFANYAKWPWRADLAILISGGASSVGTGERCCPGILTDGRDDIEKPPISAYIQVDEPRGASAGIARDGTSRLGIDAVKACY